VKETRLTFPCLSSSSPVPALNIQIENFHPQHLHPRHLREGSDILKFHREQEMLESWHEFVEEVDPDLIIGYNTSQFDIPYLMDRVQALKVTDFPYFLRLDGALAVLSLSSFPFMRVRTRTGCCPVKGLTVSCSRRCRPRSRSPRSCRERPETESGRKHQWRDAFGSTCSRSTSTTTSSVLTPSTRSARISARIQLSFHLSRSVKSLFRYSLFFLFAAVLPFAGLTTAQGPLGRTDKHKR
jgi:hypothetical protein